VADPNPVCLPGLGRRVRFPATRSGPEPGDPIAERRAANQQEMLTSDFVTACASLLEITTVPPTSPYCPASIGV